MAVFRLQNFFMKYPTSILAWKYLKARLHTKYLWLPLKILKSEKFSKFPKIFHVNFSRSLAYIEFWSLFKVVWQVFRKGTCRDILNTWQRVYHYYPLNYHSLKNSFQTLQFWVFSTKNFTPTVLNFSWPTHKFFSGGKCQKLPQIT